MDEPPLIVVTPPGLIAPLATFWFVAIAVPLVVRFRIRLRRMPWVVLALGLLVLAAFVYADAVEQARWWREHVRDFAPPWWERIGLLDHAIYAGLGLLVGLLAALMFWRIDRRAARRGR